ncbi:4-hydroxy-tetrahydrodipicolinate reductase [Jiella sp. MQZ9-1]|uniref:4-hydroxy-tetrahydrodipicolinate reductase n=1 Tax=Jiella flava TaxID=2816857 RepID=A0A939FSF6_9HYPH|nr:4-hydroxy-tetrahydrodipicolinate reductase [Jiella flava]MBO0661058.1 4-hydroxy-tetrahydrodipicolinate reductase [Jiella flava]MCD2469705.1 4-hydroxy-tetrahydrodipicolinate reductase [Jiella flava]
MKLVVLGAAGRMGRTLVKVIAETEGASLHAALAREGSASIGADAGIIAGIGASDVAISSDVDRALQGADGIVDFTAPAISLAFAEKAAERRLVHVIGTTGFQAEQDSAIASAAKAGATIVKSGNMSLGVNLLAVLVEQAAEALGPDTFDIEVLEMHHRHKVDAPSGTALLLGAAAAKGRGVALEDAAVKVRDGITGAREAGTIGFATLRGGSVVGEHSVILAGEGERINLSHAAGDRAIFARGAVKAALWAGGKPAGLYSMRDVLGLS